MDPLHIGIEITKLIVTIVGAIVVAWYWSRAKDQLERYQYLDQTYNEILKAYFEHPQFGNFQLTSSYVSAFKDTDALRYHYFAMRVHTFLESVFDLSRRHRRSRDAVERLVHRVRAVLYQQHSATRRKGNIPDEWQHIYRHHRRLHSAWLQDHRDLHEPGYIDHVFD